MERKVQRPVARRLPARNAAPGLRVSGAELVAWVCILGLALLVLGGLAVNQGGLLKLAYPAAALATGALLYWKRPTLYLGFTWWLWFLTPAVRRLIDYRAGWDPTNPVMLAPFLVAGLAFLALLRHLPKLQLSTFFPMSLVFLGLFYGYLVGVFRSGLFAATFDLLNWLVPVIFAFYLMVNWRSYPEYRRAIQRTFVWGVLIMGLYGLVQFLSPPAWDQYWLQSASITSAGAPEAFSVRVFSTLNSPGPFALVMLAGLLILLGRGGPLRWPASVAGYASFLLALVRSTWGGWIIGVLFIIARQGQLRLRAFRALVVTALLALPLLYFGPVAEAVGSRLQTLTNLGSDVSLNARLEFYSEFAPQAFLNLVGDGMGSTGLATRLGTAGGQLGELGTFDSGVMNVAFVLGWPGTLLYAGGLTWLCYYALRRGGAALDLFAVTSQGIVVAVLAQLLFDNFLVGVTGMVFWTFLGLSLAARFHAARLALDRKRSAAGVQEAVPGRSFARSEGSR